MTDATNGALLPCPFCGSDARLQESVPQGKDCRTSFIVRCRHGEGDDFFSGCLGNHTNLWDVSPEDAAKRWNRRQPTASAGMVEVMKELMAELYFEAYHSGHYDTIEAKYADVDWPDAKDHLREKAEAWLNERVPDMLAAHESQSPKLNELSGNSGQLGEPGRLPPPIDSLDLLREFCAVGMCLAADSSDGVEDAYRYRMEHAMSNAQLLLAANESQQKPRVNVGTIGHVSRDKSTLVAALTKVVSPNADTTPDVSKRGQECEADKLLIALGLDPVRFRTEGGLLNAGKIKAALKRPEDYSGLYLGRDCCKRCGSPKSKRMRSSAGSMDVCDDCGVPRFASGNKPTDNAEGE